MKNSFFAVENTVVRSRKQRVSGFFARTALVIVLAFLTVAVLFPLYFVLVTSVKSYSDFVLNPLGINFSAIMFSNYTQVLQAQNFAGGFVNSILTTAVSVLCAVVFSALVAFAVGVIRFRGSQIFIFIALATMFFTGEMTYVPMYLLYNRLKLLNTFWVLILPSLVAFPGFGILVGSAFIRKIPNSVHEAAFMDGAGVMRTFLTIDLKLLSPILSMVAIMQFQGAWSDFFWPMITVSGNPSAYTLPLLLINFKAADATMYGQYCAGLMVMTIPIVLFYIFFSKYFMQGMAAGAVKG